MLGRLHQVSEGLYIKQLVQPATVAVGTVTVTDVEVREFYSGALLLDLGLVTATGTVDVTVSHADEAGGTYTAIFNATQLAQADQSNIYILDLNLRNPNIKPYLKFDVIVATDTANLSASLLLNSPRRAVITQSATTLDMAGTWTAGIEPDLS